MDQLDIKILNNKSLINKVNNCSDKDNPQENNKLENFKVQVYKRRWLTMSLFILYATTTNGQWIEFSIIANIVSRYWI